MRVLVVEDERGVARFIRRALAEVGFAVDLCRRRASGPGSAKRPTNNELNAGERVVHSDGEQTPRPA